MNYFQLRQLSAQHTNMILDWTFVQQRMRMQLKKSTTPIEHLDLRSHK